MPRSLCSRNAAAPPTPCWRHRDAITRTPDDVLVIFGDTPLIRPQTLLRIREGLRKGAAVVVLGFRPRNATGYGRLVVEGGELVAIREELDASPAERAIELCNGGLHGVFRSVRAANPRADRQRQSQRRILSHRCHRHRPHHGVTRRSSSRPRRTTCAESTPTHSSRRPKPRCGSACARAAMEAGVTLVAPETVFLSSDTKFGRDVVVEQFVVFGPGVAVEDNALIRSFSHLDRAHVGQRRGGRALRSLAARCAPAG